jgi:adenosine deaminase
MTSVPQAELHVHVEATAPPELVQRLGARNGIEVPDDLFAWTDFLDFLRRYDRMASVFRTGEDYRDVVREYLVGRAAHGALYIELICSPDHAREQGLGDAEHLEGIAAGIDDARAEAGIEARVVLTGLRHLGVEAVAAVAQYAASRPHPYVVGFNLAGDEAGFPAGAFEEAYAIAAAAGLGCTVHAGEWDGAASVRAALELPGVTRIGHGVRAVEDAGLVRELAARGTVLEVCPTSNIALGVFPSWEAHPLRRLRDAGVRITLGSDDPAWFGASLDGEYDAARDKFGLSVEDLRDITRTALEAAFCDPALRRALLTAM